MPSWNETHYARAQEFTRLLVDALAAVPAPSVRSAPPAAAPAPAPAPVATPPSSAEPLLAAIDLTPAVPPPAPPATGANLFKKIPWKK